MSIKKQTVSMRQIEEIGRAIGTHFNPHKVILFGSYAEGRATPDSDVDILVVMSYSGSRIDKSVEIRTHIRPAFPVDLLVRTPQSIRKRLFMGDQFMRSVIEHGKVIYESADA